MLTQIGTVRPGVGHHLDISFTDLIPHSKPLTLSLPMETCSIFTYGIQNSLDKKGAIY